MLAAYTPQNSTSVRLQPGSVHGCRQPDEVQVSIGRVSSEAPQPLSIRIMAGAGAQKHWLLPCAGGLLGIHVLKEYCTAVQDALRMSALDWETALR